MTSSPFLSIERNDVTKQDDLGRMYKYLLNQKTSQEPLEKRTNRREEVPHEEDVKRQGVSESEEDTKEKSSKSESSPTSQPQAAVTDDEQNEENSESIVGGVSLIESISDPLPAEPQETKEERRKRLFSKRTSEEAALSAKERYLARKRAKVSQPTIANDD